MGSNAVLALDEVRQGSAIEVRNNASYKGVFAREDIKKGSVILYLKGTVSTQPSKYTIQLGNQRHLNAPAARNSKDAFDYCWEYLNHHCEPNSYLNATELTFRALRDIASGEEITFNYLTTESEMAKPFDCTCGSPNCFGFVQGLNFLTQDEVDRLFLAVGEDNVVAPFMPSSQGEPVS
jgi:SET domain-containing protein